MILLVFFTVNFAIGQHSAQSSESPVKMTQTSETQTIASRPLAPPENATNLERKMTMEPKIFSTAELRSSLAVHTDTLPSSPKMEELQSKMETKSKEMDALAEKFESSIDKNLESEIAKLESLMHQLEEKQEASMTKIMELENSEAMKRIEKCHWKLKKKCNLMNRS